MGPFRITTHPVFRLLHNVADIFIHAVPTTNQLLHQPCVFVHVIEFLSDFTDTGITEGSQELISARTDTHLGQRSIIVFPIQIGGLGPFNRSRSLSEADGIAGAILNGELPQGQLAFWRGRTWACTSRSSRRVK